MRLNLQEILHSSGAEKRFSFCLDLSGMEFFGDRPFAQPIAVSGRVRNQADVLLLEGVAESILDLPCDRCLKPMEKEMRVPVEFMLSEHLEEEESDTILPLEDGAIDLDEVFTTAVVLALDAKHLCSEDCKGLCPQCGADLNEGPCACKPEPDPRLAALAQLLDSDE
ncbi:MAG: DUF177 domain-containing protein [Oscillospiraceae bacterium]|nr:DUF177 domain-containing protein [Oscillospiraceae bacterium]